MKIRVQGNSIRLRLTQPDVQEFDRNKVLTESVQFPEGQQFQYQILQTAQAFIGATFDQSAITIQIPEKEARQWIQSDQVGIEQNLDLESGDQLRILVEKDFQCLHQRPGEDETDAFLNPKAKR